MPEGPGLEGPGRPVEVYRRLGLLAGPQAFPAVAGFSVLAGPTDSSLVLFGLSLPASALRFQREGAGFSAEYVVALRFVRDGRLVAMVDRRERVQVSTFAETTRSDESVIFQTPVLLAPGGYAVSVRVRDALSARGLETTDTLTVAAPDAVPRLAAPLLTYRAVPRTAPVDTPSLVLNPRRAVPYGGAGPVVYIEGYGAVPDTVRVELLDEKGRTTWARDVRLEPGTGMGAVVLHLPPDSLPLGRFGIRSMAGERISPVTSGLVTISDDWAVANFDDMLHLLHYVADAEEVDPMVGATAERRRALWDEFWARRDPFPATPANEYRDTFFERVRYAAEQFEEGGTPGWRTQRGEVYIVLGPPTYFAERLIGRSLEGAGEANAQDWIYDGPPAGRLDLLFVDRTGSGTYRLTAASDASFRAVARRLRIAF